MTNIPSEILLSELNRMVRKLSLVTDPSMVQMLTNYANDLTRELLYRGDLCSV